MRGKESTGISIQSHIRITPAYAGKRWSTALGSQSPRDHPRLCGEKMNSQTAGVRSLGSPPPMRGKAACILCTVCTCQDHPRLCGEKGKQFLVKWLLIGSPPPMRGKVREPNAVLHEAKDHPRLCGEKWKPYQDTAAEVGSPPPMRGKESI